ncbi:BnaA03g57620D, partial [Brassica napus]
MAGMLPGVECARRRRFHGATGQVWTRRPSFSLYTTNHDQAYVSFSERNVRNKSYSDDNDEKLVGAAKEA